VRVVHVHGGRYLLEKIELAGIEGELLEWSDVLVVGETPNVATRDEWYDARSRALEEVMGPAEAIPYRDRLLAQDCALDIVARDPNAEIVLWFGPELFCQAILIALLARLGDRPHVSLVAPGDIAGKPRGCTVSYLNDEELRAAFAVRAAVMPTQVAIARRVWDAWRAEDARAQLTAIAATDTSALPHIGAAIARWLEEPAKTDALVRAATAQGAKDFRAIYRAVQDAEARPWLTEEMLLDRLARPDAPRGPRSAT
jgi:hypothetical protein